jgi:nitrogen-specific signal transduction histidine kinase/outer membrane protein assembly factor BamB
MNESAEPRDLKRVYISEIGSRGPVRLLVAVAALVASLAMPARGAPVLTDASRLWEQQLTSVAPVEIDGDSIDELIVVDNYYSIDPKSQQLRSLIATRMLHQEGVRRVSACGAMDKDRMWATFVRNDSLFALDLWPSREFFVVVGHDRHAPQHWDGEACDGFTLPNPKTGKPELILNVSTGWDCAPRGLVALDWETGKRSWSCFTGPNLRWPTLYHGYVGEASAILYGTMAPGNGNAVGNEYDSCTYVFLFNASGHPVWRTRIGHYSSSAKPMLIDVPGKGNNRAVIVCELGSPAGDRRHDDIVKLDVATGRILKRVSFGTFNGDAEVVPIDSGTAVVVGCSDDTLRILDANLRVIKRWYAGGDVIRLLSGRFTGRNKCEIAAAMSNCNLTVFDLDGTALCTWEPSPGRPAERLVRVRNGRQDRLLVDLSGEPRLWQLYEFTSMQLLKRKVPIWTLLAGAGIFVVCLVLLLVAGGYTKTRDIRVVIRNLTGQAGVVELNNRGRIVRINSKAKGMLSSAGGQLKARKRLSGLADYAQLASLVQDCLKGSSVAPPMELALRSAAGQNYLARATRIRSGVLLTIEVASTVEYLERTSSWVPVAQKLAHDIKSRLTTMSWAIQRLEKRDTEERAAYLKDVEDEVGALIRMADGFMRLTRLDQPVLVPGDVNDIGRSCVERSVLAKHSTVDVRYNLEELLPVVLFDRKELATALQNIVENALTAMNQSGTLTISTRSVDGGARVEISVADTGVGIPERYLEKVLDPYFTLKPGGTGLGMSLAKKTIDDHGGTISIASHEGEGTTVTITLPAVGQTGTAIAGDTRT